MSYRRGLGVCRFSLGPKRREGRVGNLTESNVQRKGVVMQYIFLLHGNENDWAQMTEEQMELGMKAYADYSDALVRAGVMRGGNELMPTAHSKVVRNVKGKTLTTDGPFAEAKEQLGGYFVVEVKNEAEALEWAAKCPGAFHGAVEVRPIIDHPEPTK